MVINRAFRVDRRRQVLLLTGLAATAVVVATFVASGDGDPATRVPVAADQVTTTAPPPRPLAPIGPVPRKLVMNWRVRLSIEADATQVEVVGGQMLVASATALHVYDAATGAPRWYLSARDPVFDEYWEPHVQLDGRRVIIDRHTPGKPDLWTTVEMTSGRIVRNAHTPPPPSPTRSAPPLPGGVKITEGGGLAVDAPSGRNLYTRDHFSVDTNMGTRQAGDYLVIPGTDDRLNFDRHYLAVINVRTGQARTLTVPAISALDIDDRRIYASTYTGPIGSVQIIELSSGVRRSLPLPNLGDAGLHSPDNHPFQMIAAGGRLILGIADPFGSSRRVDLIAVSATR